ncbi:MspA family porin [Nocardia terpenica]|uniref:MspA family protein n=1 Tax=Nocardia terpenica TaxID=455432 RepID=A0A291RI55_9NOCA|nr:MspA family porin [Nocardia terpenica]ATL66979.1 hypothetical protein CRH09_12950 [Nocardia terpenica]
MSPGLWKVCLVVAAAGALCHAPAAHAEVQRMPPHEKTFASAFGTFTVGTTNETVDRIPPLNMVATTREALVGYVSYGRVNGGAGGALKTGYHVGCAVTIQNGSMAFNPQPSLGFGGSPTMPNGSLLLSPTVAVNVAPGEVKEVAVAEKALIPNQVVQTVIRDFHIVVNGCTGPVTIRQFTYLFAKSPQVDDSGAVFGDPTWL